SANCKEKRQHKSDSQHTPPSIESTITTSATARARLKTATYWSADSKIAGSTPRITHINASSTRPGWFSVHNAINDAVVAKSGSENTATEIGTKRRPRGTSGVAYSRGPLCRITSILIGPAAH